MIFQFANVIYSVCLIISLYMQDRLPFCHRDEFLKVLTRRTCLHFNSYAVLPFISGVTQPLTRIFRGREIQVILIT